MKVLVTGGAGYIGGHTCKAIARRGWTPIIVDNLSTGHRGAVRWGELHEFDIRDTNRLTLLMKTTRPDAVFHFAASAYVGGSMQHPLDYYDNNVRGMVSLLQACVSVDVPNLVFSSSCTTYGLPETVPIHEGMPTNPISPYGETKLVCERLLHWTEQAHRIRWIALRYFNAAGADPDGETGELHNPETHLIPLALKAAANSGPALSVFGDDYPTEDGTAIRDYIHVSDLADAHVAAVSFLIKGGSSQAINLGTGRGHSVMEVIRTIQGVTGLSVPHQISPRRAGDPPELWADPTLAKSLLQWEPRHADLADIVSTAWNWERGITARGGRK